MPCCPVPKLKGILHIGKPFDLDLHHSNWTSLVWYSCWLSCAKTYIHLTEADRLWPKLFSRCANLQKSLNWWECSKCIRLRAYLLLARKNWELEWWKVFWMERGKWDTKFHKSHGQNPICENWHRINQPNLALEQGGLEGGNSRDWVQDIKISSLEMSAFETKQS